MLSNTNATEYIPSNTNIIMNIVKMVEVHIEDQKVSLPSRLDWSQSNAERDLIF